MQFKNSPRNLDLCFRNPETHVHILLLGFPALGVGRDWGGSGAGLGVGGSGAGLGREPSKASTAITAIHTVIDKNGYLQKRRFCKYTFLYCQAMVVDCEWLVPPTRATPRDIEFIGF